MTRLVIVGPGRVGSAFRRAAEAAGVRIDVVRRGEPIPNVPPGTPILLATRADALDGLIAATPAANRPDLVFVQNGMFLPVLRAHGLANPTLGLVYFAATSKDGPVEPGAPTLFHGPHAAAFVALLTGAGTPAVVVDDPAAFAREIAVKLAWNVIFGLLGDTYGEDVGASAARVDEVTALATEIAPVLARGVAADVPVPMLVERLLAYSRAIPTFRAGVRELPWRSGWIVKAASDYGLATPRHDAALRALGHL